MGAVRPALMSPAYREHSGHSPPSAPVGQGQPCRPAAQGADGLHHRCWPGHSQRGWPTGFARKDKIRMRFMLLWTCALRSDVSASISGQGRARPPSLGLRLGMASGAGGGQAWARPLSPAEGAHVNDGGLTTNVPSRSRVTMQLSSGGLAASARTGGSGWSSGLGEAQADGQGASLGVGSGPVPAGQRRGQAWGRVPCSGTGNQRPESTGTRMPDTLPQASATCKVKPPSQRQGTNAK